MPDNFQFPYQKILRNRGQSIPAEDHNKQERQIECLTEAVGQYDFVAGTIETRLVALAATPVISALNDINDVNVPSPSDGQVLSWDAGSSRWIAVDIATSLDDLTDTDLAGASALDSLVLVGGEWVPRRRHVTVASDLPGGPDEVTANEVTEIRFITQQGPTEDHFVTEISAGVVYIGGGTPPAVLGGDLTGLPALVTGKMSQSNINFPPTTSAGDTYDRITQSSSFTFNHPGGQFGNASLGNLILEVNGVDVANIDLAANFDEGNRPGSQTIATYNTTGTGSPIVAGVVTFPGGTLAVTAVGTSSLPTDTFQQGTAVITVTAAALQQGYNSVQLRHTSGAVATNLLEWFYDTDPDGAPDDPIVSSITIVEDVPVLALLSGVPYYDEGSTFNLDLVADRAFDNVYHESEIPVLIDVSDFGDASAGINIADGSVSGLSTPPDIGESMTVDDFTVTAGDDVQIVNPDADATPRDPYASYLEQTAGSDFVIQSAGPTSTDVFESFLDERYRLPSSTNFDIPVPGMPGPPAVWDSSVLLTDVSRTSELQVYDEASSPSNRLIHPTVDYLTASRSPQPAPDYSSLAGGASFVYRRVFRSTIGSRTNGILTFPGLADADIVADIGLRIKIPGRTVWLDITTAFNGATFPTGAPLVGGVDGEGARINSGVNSPDINSSIEFSLGAIGTDATSDFQLILEITYASAAVAEVLGSGAGVSLSW